MRWGITGLRLVMRGGRGWFDLRFPRGGACGLFVGCLILRRLRFGFVGRVSPRRATYFLARARKLGKEARPAFAPLRGPRPPDAPGGVLRKLALRAQTGEAPFSARRILRLARQRAGRSCPRERCNVDSLGIYFSVMKVAPNRPAHTDFSHELQVLNALHNADVDFGVYVTRQMYTSVPTSTTR